MGDRICIRLTDGTDVTPTFYGHWCGLRGLKVMIETLNEPANTMGCIMCNFIVKVKEGHTSPYSYDIWNADEGEGAANGDWWMWTYHLKRKTWTTTHPRYRHLTMTSEELEEVIKTIRPCLYRKCKCDQYGGPECEVAFYERHMLVHDGRQQKLPVE